MVILSDIVSISANTSAIRSCHVGMYVASRAIASKVLQVLMNTTRTSAQTGACIPARMGIGAKANVVTARKRDTHPVELRFHTSSHAVIRLMSHAMRQFLEQRLALILVSIYSNVDTSVQGHAACAKQKVSMDCANMIAKLLSLVDTNAA